MKIAAVTIMVWAKEPLEEPVMREVVVVQIGCQQCLKRLADTAEVDELAFLMIQLVFPAISLRCAAS